MLTIFSIPKPFQDNISIIQRNALQSWTHLHPDCEVFLFGDETGITDIAQDYNIGHIKNIPKNEYGTPLLNFVFEKIQEIAKNNYICYVNTDIILTSDIITALDNVTQFPEFLLVGRRINVEIQKSINISESFETDFIDFVKKDWTPGRPDQIDCFVFPKGMVKDMPPFAVGRAGWDNWLIADTKRKRIPIIDGTTMFHVVHQNHDYSHIKNQKSDSWEGPETDRNRELMGGMKNLYNIDDADWFLLPEGLKKKNRGIKDIYRSIWRSIKK